MTIQDFLSLSCVEKFNYINNVKITSKSPFWLERFAFAIRESKANAIMLLTPDNALIKAYTEIKHYEKDTI